MVVKKDLGTRLVCSDCGKKFYDLHRSQPQCPKCGGSPAIYKRLKMRVSRLMDLDVEPDDEDVVLDEMEIVPLDSKDMDFSEDYSEEALV